GFLGKLLGDLLVEKSSLGSQINDWSSLINSLNGSKNWLGLHHHACTAPIRIVIYNMMLISSCITNVVQHDAEQSTLLCSFQNALAKWPLEHCWEKSEDIEVHMPTHLSRYVLQYHCCL